MFDNCKNIIEKIGVVIATLSMFLAAGAAAYLVCIVIPWYGVVAIVVPGIVFYSFVTYEKVHDRGVIARYEILKKYAANRQDVYGDTINNSGE